MILKLTSRHKIDKHDFSKFNEEEFVYSFLLFDWTQTFLSDSDLDLDVNIKFYVFFDQISQLANAIVPQKKLSKGELKLSTEA